MAEMQVSHDDIHGLAQTLRQLKLPARQKAFLSAIVALVADAIGDQDPLVAVHIDTAPSFQDQFGASFTPDEVNHLDARDRGAVNVKVSRAISSIGRGIGP
jgi:hypothetical protein